MEVSDLTNKALSTMVVIRPHHRGPINQIKVLYIFARYFALCAQMRVPACCLSDI